VIWKNKPGEWLWHRNFRQLVRLFHGHKRKLVRWQHNRLQILRLARVDWRGWRRDYRAGGDKRGRQSAAIYVVKPKGGYGGFIDRWIDYRVDDHEDPVPHLGKLLELQELYFGKSPESEHVKITGKAEKQLTDILTGTGYLKKGENFKNAFNEFIGNENFEERADPEAKWIDKPVLKHLVKKYQKD
jgi:uncharacterized Ntn-hydrolase superfamily protein